jgi:hypothetical protein
MSKLVRGDQLPSDLRREILARYLYRWTSDNQERERAWRGIKGAPTIPLVSDAQWLREHAFYVTDRGTLDKRKKGAEPAYMMEHESPGKPQHATRKFRDPLWYRWAVNYRDTSGKIRQEIVDSTTHKDAIVAVHVMHPNGRDFTATKLSSEPLR